MTNCPKIAKKFQIECNRYGCCTFDDKFVYHNVIGSGSSDSFVVKASYYNKPIAVKISIHPGKKRDLIPQLEYEAKIYEQIINNLCIGKRMSPNFVWYIGTSICKRINFTDQYTPLKLKKFNKQYKSIYKKKGSPDTKLLVIEGLSKFIDVYDYIQNKNGSTETKIKNLLFQILYNLYLMQEIKLSHYDMHMGNIALELDTSKLGTLHTHDVCYKLKGGTIYKINVKNFLIKLFDWDMGYHKSIGKNNSLDGNLCEDYKRCNKYTRGWDVKHVLMNIIDNISSNGNTILAKKIMKVFKIGEREMQKWLPWGNTDPIEMKYMNVKKLLESSYFDEFRVTTCNGIPKKNIFGIKYTKTISNINKPTKAECDLWLKNKKVNPRNKRPLNPNGRIYKVLETTCK